jgi:elongation factor G
MHRLRTFGIVAHIDAGKTTLTERILHDAGAQAWVGSVDEGTAATDWLPQERARGISITAAATRVAWAGHVLQVVDTPGHVDFVAEVERCLHVLDGVVVVVDGVRGIESQTEAVWQQAEARALPRLVFVNKLDRPGADYGAVVAALRQTFECVPVPIVVPLFDAQGSFAGLGDAASGAVQWFDGRPAPALASALQAELRAAHDRLVEAVADVDEAVLADVVAGRTIDLASLRASLRRAVLQNRLVPVLAGAALWNRGVDWLLDAVANLLPGPLDRRPAGLWAADRAADPAAPFCGLVFKVQHVDSVWNFVRVVRGILRVGDVCGRSRAGLPSCEVGELWTMQADRHQSVAEAIPGEIVVVPGELGLRTGETLFAPETPVTLPTPRFPAPVLAVSFEAEQAEQAPKLLAVLRAMAIDDPTLRVDHDHGQIVVRGMGELHLDVIAEMLRQRAAVPFRTGRPQVDRRETIAGPGSAAVEVRAQVGGLERAATCRLSLEPTVDPAQAPVLEVRASPSEAVVACEQCLRDLLTVGRGAGSWTGVRAVVEAAGLDPGEFLEPLVHQAATKALAAAAGQAGVRHLEPWVAIDLWCPEESCAAVLADLGARAAEVAGVSSGRLGARIRGRAPLSRMLGYVTRLRSISKGRGQADLRPAGYAVVP